jgi:hypothetical protein
MWGRWTWPQYCCPKNVHVDPRDFSRFLTWVRDIKEVIRKAKKDDLYGYCSCIALSIGLIISDLDIRSGVQGTVMPFESIQSYVRKSKLDDDVIHQYLLPACQDMTTIIQQKCEEIVASSSILVSQDLHSGNTIVPPSTPAQKAP